MLRLLLVEPDKTMGQTYLKYFQELGYQVSWAQTSEQALEVIDSEMPNIIILELQIPVHNGLELLYEIRSYSDWEPIKIIINTSVKEFKLKQSMVYKQLKISKYLYKPDTGLEKLKLAIESIATD